MTIEEPILCGGGKRTIRVGRVVERERKTRCLRRDPQTYIWGIKGVTKRSPEN